MEHEHVWERYELTEEVRLPGLESYFPMRREQRAWYVGYTCRTCGEEGYAA